MARNMRLTKMDRVVLNSYIPVLENLASYLGNSFEIVLHSLEDYDHSVICIINGEHTGRTVGAPITDLALDMLDAIAKGKPAVYFSKNKKGEPLKSTTIPIRGEDNRIVGLICINMYLNTSLDDFINSLVPTERLAPTDNAQENFAANTNELISTTLASVREVVCADDSILPSNKNKKIVESLYEKGIFRLKDAVPIIADFMGVSKNTIYMHIRNYRKESKPL